MTWNQYILKKRKASWKKKHRKHTYKNYLNHRNKAEFRDAIQPFSLFLPETISYIFLMTHNLFYFPN